MKKLLIIVAVVAIVAGGGVFLAAHLTAEAPVKYRTVKVVRGDLKQVVNATGTVEPEEVVDVGSQATGIIDKLGTDVNAKPSTPGNPKTIDYGSVVDAGEVLAQIDDRVYVAQVAQAQATLDKSKAALGQEQAKLVQAEQDLKRAQDLFPKGAMAQADYDLYVAAEKTAVANVGVDQATIEVSQAALDLAKTTLGYTKITAPVKGVIVSRRVNVGQTVVSNMSASSLFLLAKDLSRIQVWASVNEADIGSIHPGVPVSFTVDTYPNDTFHGTVVQVRLNAQMTQNVVTYTVVVETDNADLRLLPYLTATLKFEIQDYKNVLMVPNAALRWKPKPQRVVADLRDAYRADNTLAAAFAAPVAQETDDAAEGQASDKAAAAAPSPPQAKSTVPAKSAGTKPASTTSPGTKPAATTPAGTKSADTKSADTKSAAGGSKSKSGNRKERGLLWVLDKDNPNFLRPIPVRIGATDGVNTIVSSKDKDKDLLKEGTEVISGEAAAAEASSTDATNPFAPSFGKKPAAPKKDS
jgi:HlyD family secretion protein